MNYRNSVQRPLTLKSTGVLSVVTMPMGHPYREIDHKITFYHYAMICSYLRYSSLVPDRRHYLPEDTYITKVHPGPVINL